MLARAVLLLGCVIANVCSSALDGIDAVLVSVECEIARGLPHYNVVGLPAPSVKEGAVRIRAALDSVGADLPLKKITVNLAPADLKKVGCALDLPIALAVLIGGTVGDEAPPEAVTALSAPVNDLIVLGELGLDGSVRAVRGVLAAAMLARELGMRGVLVPEANASEALAVEDVEVYSIAHLRELVSALEGTAHLRPAQPRRRRVAAGKRLDMAEVRGQYFARAALEVAVAGGHNILLTGPPGTGKTMLARRMPTILPPLARTEALETTKVYSSLGLAAGVVEERPFRAPHHTISAAALLGGGAPPRPGEISLAHNGVLFLDELPEFSRTAIEGLREPLEEREVTITRVSGSLHLPASFLLVGAANPCPCGWRDSGVRNCTCTSGEIARYSHRLSGPLLDRIDLQAFVKPISLAELREHQPGESSAAIRERVIEARARQRARLAAWNLHCNAEMTSPVLRATCQLDSAAERTLADLVERRRSFTARSIDRLLKVSRTIADLMGRDAVDSDALREAAQYRDVDPVADVLPKPSPKPRRRHRTGPFAAIVVDAAAHDVDDALTVDAAAHDAPPRDESVDAAAHDAPPRDEWVDAAAHDVSTNAAPTNVVDESHHSSLEDCHDTACS